MSTRVTDVEGNWEIVDFPHHPEYVSCKIEIKGHGLDPNVFKIHIHVVNHLTCILQHNSTTDQWESHDFFSTEKGGTPQTIDEEHVFRKLILSLYKLEVHNEQELIMTTNNDQDIRLKRLPN